MSIQDTLEYGMMATHVYPDYVQAYDSANYGFNPYSVNNGMPQGWATVSANDLKWNSGLNYDNSIADSEYWSNKYWVDINNDNTLTQQQKNAIIPFSDLAAGAQMNGFYARLYVNDAKNEVVIAFEGSESLNYAVSNLTNGDDVIPPDNIKDSNLDWIGNDFLGVFTDVIEPQIYPAYHFTKWAIDALSASSKYHNYSVSFTGHSLGGSLSAAMGVYFQKTAYAFNEVPIRQTMDQMLTGENLHPELGTYGWKDISPGSPKVQISEPHVYGDNTFKTALNNYYSVAEDYINYFYNHDDMARYGAQVLADGDWDYELEQLSKDFDNYHLEDIELALGLLSPTLAPLAALLIVIVGPKILGSLTSIMDDYLWDMSAEINKVIVRENHIDIDKAQIYWLLRVFENAMYYGKDKNPSDDTGYGGSDIIGSHRTEVSQASDPGDLNGLIDENMDGREFHSLSMMNWFFAMDVANNSTTVGQAINHYANEIPDFWDMLFDNSIYTFLSKSVYNLMGWKAVKPTGGVNDAIKYDRYEDNTYDIMVGHQAIMMTPFVKQLNGSVLVDGHYVIDLFNTSGVRNNIAKPALVKLILQGNANAAQDAYIYGTIKQAASSASMFQQQEDRLHYDVEKGYLTIVDFLDPVGHSLLETTQANSPSAVSINLEALAYFDLPSVTGGMYGKGDVDGTDFDHDTWQGLPDLIRALDSWYFMLSAALPNAYTLGILSIFDKTLNLTAYDPDTGFERLVMVNNFAATLDLRDSDLTHMIFTGLTTEEIYGGTEKDFITSPALSVLSVENVFFHGEGGSDTLIGGYADDTLSGDDGSDYLNGDGSWGINLSYPNTNWAFYQTSPNAILLNMWNKHIVDNDGFSYQDTLYSVQGLIGSDYNDIMTLVAGAYIDGYEIDTVKGEEGNDSIYLDYEPLMFLDDVTIYGGTGNDTVSVPDITETGGGLDESLIEYVDEGIDWIFGRAYVVPQTFDMRMTPNVEGFDLQALFSLNTVYGNALENTILGSNWGDYLYGGDANDTIISSEGLEWSIDKIWGQDGNDSLMGGEGWDYIYGGIGDDTVWSFGGNDLVEGGDGEDHLNTGTGSDLVYGNNDNDTIITALGHEGALTGILSADTAYGGNGDDQIFASEGSDKLYGGAGADTVIANGNDDGLWGDGENDILLGGWGADELHGGTGNDTLRGDRGFYDANIETYVFGDSSDVLYGGDDNDTLFGDREQGNPDADYLYGGDGDDYMVISDSLITEVPAGGGEVPGVDGVDYAYESGGEGRDTVVSPLSYHLLESQEIEVLILKEGSPAIEGFGNEIVNEIYGNSNANVLDGMGAADQLYGASGNDTYYVDNVGDVANETWHNGSGNGDIDWVMSSVNYTLGTNLENLDLIDEAIEGIGNGLSNKIYGDLMANILSGLGSVDLMFGDIGNDTIFGNTGTDIIYGQFDDDMLYGGQEVDSLYGGIGNDTLIGGEGDDYYQGGSLWSDVYWLQDQGDYGIADSYDIGIVDLAIYDARDKFSEIAKFQLTSTSTDFKANESDNQIYGTFGNQLIYGYGGQDIIYGDKVLYDEFAMPASADGNDTFYAGTGHDIAYGNGGNDWFIGDGDDNFHGNLGDDYFIVGGSSSVIELDGEGEDTIESSVDYTLAEDQFVEDLVLRMGSAAAIGIGNQLSNKIYGNQNANFLSGRKDGHVDLMFGGLGDDTYLAYEAGEVVSEGPNSGGIDLVLAQIDFILPSDIDNLTLEESEALIGIGNALANQIIGNSNDNEIQGQSGGDFILSGDGSDTIYGGMDRDSLYSDGGIPYTQGMPQYDVAYMGNGDDFARMSEWANTVFGGNDDDVLYAIGGDDLIYGDAGVTAGIGKDTIYGGWGNDTAYGGERADLIYGDESNLTDWTFDDFLYGDEGADSIVGGAGNDYLDGGTENDILSGNTGDDTIVGSDDPDTMAGGAGNDVIQGDGVNFDQPNPKVGNGDLAVFSGLIENYRFTYAAASHTLVVNNFNGADGIDSVSDVPYYRFADGTYALRTPQDLPEPTGFVNVEPGPGTDTDPYWDANGTLIFGGASTTGHILAAGSFTGWVNGNDGSWLFHNDIDDYRVELAVGVAYVITLHLNGSSLDGTILRLRAPDFSTVLYADVASDNQNAQIAFISAAAGTYYVEAEFQGVIGYPAYTLTVGGPDAWLERIGGDSITLPGGEELPEYTGGMGDDTILIVNSPVARGARPEHELPTQHIMAGDGNDIVTGSNRSEWIEGQFHNDSLIGNGNEDTLDGGEGNDTLDGGTGSDLLVGGLGDDLYILDDASDDLEEDVDGGHDRVIASVNHSLAANFEDLTLVGAAISGTGNALDNVLIGNGQANYLDGGLGADSLRGAQGDDTLVAGNGDTLRGGLGNDVYLATADAGTVVIDEGEDTAHADDRLILSAGLFLADLTLDRVGDDLLITSANTTWQVVNQYHNGSGRLDLIIDSEGDTLSLKQDTLVTGTADADTLFGHEDDDAIYGYAGEDSLLGYSGNDLLDGGAGADTLVGEIGNDSYVVDNEYDVILDAEGHDLILSSIDWTLANDSEDLTLTGAVGLVGTGNALGNQLTGTNSADTLRGLAGLDTLSGNDGDDFVLGDGEGGAAFGQGADLLYGNAGNDTLVGGAGSDTLHGGAGDDVLLAHADSLTVEVKLRGVGSYSAVLDNDGNASNGAVAYVSGAGSNSWGEQTYTAVLPLSVAARYLDLTTYAAWMYGGDLQFSSITIMGQRIDFTSGSGLNGYSTYVLPDGRLRSLDNGYFVYDLQGILGDLLTGTSDVMQGGAGNDSLLGANGADQLTGGADDDSLAGGMGDDSYYVNASDGQDTINDQSGYDQIVLAGGTQLDDLSFQRPGNDLIVTDAIHGISIRILNHFAGAAVEQLLLANGAIVDLQGPLVIEQYGTSADDTLTGTDAIDRFNGGTGNDSLLGGLGDDLYRFAVGDGVDSIGDSGGVDRIELAAGIVAGDLVYTQVGQDLLITAVGKDLSIVVQNQFIGQYVEQLALADGSVVDLTNPGLSNAELVGDNLLSGGGATDLLLGMAGADTVIGGGAGDTLRGGEGDDRLLGDSAGGGGNDVIYGEAGNDTLRGQVGSDTLYGGAANDDLAGYDTAVSLKVWNRGDGAFYHGYIDRDYNPWNGANVYYGARYNYGGWTYVAGIDDQVSLNPDYAYFEVISQALGDLNIGEIDVMGAPLHLAAGNHYYTGQPHLNWGFGHDFWNAYNYPGTDMIRFVWEPHVGVWNIAAYFAESGYGGAPDLLFGGAGNDILRSYAGADTLDGGEGDDELHSGRGTNLIIGGAGFDTLDLTDAKGSYLQAGREPYRFGAEIDVANNLVHWRYIWDAASTDLKVDSISGIERFVLPGNGAIVHLDGAGGHLFQANGWAKADLSALAAPVALNTAQWVDGTGNLLSQFVLAGDTLAGVNNIGLTAFDDTITADHGPNAWLNLYGGAGHDLLSGNGSGGLLGEAGNDTITGATDPNGWSNQWADGGAGDDLISMSGRWANGNGGAGNDSITVTTNQSGSGNGGAGDDLITTAVMAEANPANISFWLDGGAGVDTLIGGASNDVYVIDNAGDVISNETGGNDALYSTITATLAGGIENGNLQQNWDALTGQIIANPADLIGNDADNQLSGNAFVNLLAGLAGNDRISAQDGADTLTGDAGNDSLNGDQGNDLLDGGDGADSGYGGEGGDTLIGGSDDDSLWGDVSWTDNMGAGDWLTGGAGNDQLFGQLGADTYTIALSDGTDTITDYGADADVIQLGDSIGASDLGYARVGTDLIITIGQSQTITIRNHFAGAAVETLRLYTGSTIDLTNLSLPITGTAGNDLLHGDSGANQMDGLGGADSLYGHNGADVVYGGDGNDLLSSGDQSDTTYGGAGDDLIYVYEIDPTHSHDFASGHDLAYGNDGNDMIEAISGHDTLYGGSGQDTLSGNLSDDTVYGGEGDDRLFGDWFWGAGGYEGGVPGNDVIYGDAGNDWISAGVGADTVFGGEGNDAIYLYQLNYYGDQPNQDYWSWGDYADGGDGNDFIVGVDGADTLYGGVGNDQLVGNQWEDTLYGGDGNDTVWGDWMGGAGSYAPTHIGNDLIYGDSGNDWLCGQEGYDTIYGGDGNDQIYGYLHFPEGGWPGQNFYYSDTLFGGAGNDYLGAASGADSLTGGQGDDTLSAGDGDDLYAFAVGDGSDIILETSGNDSVSITDLTYAEISFTRQSGGDLLITGSDSLGDTVSVLIDDQYYGEQFGTTARVETLVLADTVIGLAGAGLAGVTVGTTGNDSLTGTADADLIYGLAGDDMIVGAEDNDQLYGGQGRDWLASGAGADTLSGGAGSDILAGSLAELNGDIVTDLASGDLIRITDADSLLSAATINYNNTTGVLTIDGNGDETADATLQLAAGLAPQTLGIISQSSVGGTTTLLIANQAPVVATQSSYAPLHGGIADDTLVATNWYRLDGLAGNDSLVGGSSSTQLYGGAGDDTLVANSNWTQLNGGSGADRITGNGLQVTVTAARLSDLASDTLDSLGAGSTIQINLTATEAAALAHLATGDIALNGTSLSIAGTALTVTGLAGGLSLGLRDLYLNGSNGGTLTLSVDAAKSQTANANDYLYGDGGSANDYYNGAASSGGYAYGRDGNDTLIAGNNYWSLYPGLGQDLMVTGSGNGYIQGRVEELEGDTISGFGSGTTLYLNSNDDRLGSATLAYDSTSGALSLDWTGDSQADWQITTTGLSGGGSFAIAYQYGSASNSSLSIVYAAQQTVTGGSGNDYLSGGGLADSLFGDDGDDYLNGGAGGDTLSGGAGMDRFSGDLTQMNGDTITDLAYGEQIQLWSAYSTAANIAYDSVTGALTIDADGNATTDATIQLATGLEGVFLTTVQMGLGIIYVSAVAENWTGSSGYDNHNGTAGNDTLDAAGSDDYLAGLTGNDWLIGGDGNDNLNGGPNGAEGGTDTLDGGAGIDSYNATVAELNGDVITLIDTGSHIWASGKLTAGATLAPSLAYDTITGALTLDVNGDATAELSLTIVASEAGGSFGLNNIWLGLDGSYSFDLGYDAPKSISGGNGSAWLQGGGSNDTLTAGSNGGNIDARGGDDLIIGASVANSWLSVSPGLGADTIQAGTGTMNISGSLAEINGDTLANLGQSSGSVSINVYSLPWSGPQSPITAGMLDLDTVAGTLTLDVNGDNTPELTLHLSNPAAGLHAFVTGTLSPGSGNANITLATGQLITGGGGNDWLNGTTPADTIYGGDGADTLNGNFGDSLIDGGNGDDWVNLNNGQSFAGNATLTGGAGADIFRLTAPGQSFGHATITDFTPGQDHIYLDGSLTGDGTPINPLYILSTATETESGLTLTLDPNTTLTLTGLHLNDLRPEDFW